MKLRHFLKLVEIQTKVASLIPFGVGTLYVISVYGMAHFSVVAMLTFLSSLLCIDMAATALNNYMDFKRATRRTGYGYQEHNAVVRFDMSESTVVAVIATLVLTGALLGFYLVFQTHVWVLVFGIVSFATAIAYSYGPLPISRTPFGEVVSGAFMGVLIPLIAVIIQLPQDAFFLLQVDQSWISFKIRWLELLEFALMTLPLYCAIANIMLANNLCDQHEDLENCRYTLPVIVGTKKALVLYELHFFAGYISIIVLITLGGLPWWFLTYLLSFPVTFKLMNQFKERQLKSKTFVFSVMSFAIQGLSLIVLLGLWTFEKLY